MSTEIELLQQLVVNTSHSDSVLIAVVSGGAAVFGAGVSAAFGYFVARMGAKSQMAVAAASAQSQRELDTTRLRVNVVTAERLRWLQDIRQRLSRLYAQMDMQYNYLKRPIPAAQVAAMQEMFDKFSAEIMEQTNVITLMLNPQKPDQAMLRTALQDAQMYLLQCFAQRNANAAPYVPNDVTYATYKQSAFASLTAIGIEAWSRIQNLE